MIISMCQTRYSRTIEIDLLWPYFQICRQFIRQHETFIVIYEYFNVCDNYFPRCQIVRFDAKSHFVKTLIKRSIHVAVRIFENKIKKFNSSFHESNLRWIGNIFPIWQWFKIVRIINESNGTYCSRLSHVFSTVRWNYDRKSS